MTGTHIHTHEHDGSLFFFFALWPSQINFRPKKKIFQDKFF
jgi:hypothetical protein